MVLTGPVTQLSPASTCRAGMQQSRGKWMTLTSLTQLRAGAWRADSLHTACDRPVIQRKIISALNICVYIQLSSSSAMSCLSYQLAELSSVPLFCSQVIHKFRLHAWPACVAAWANWAHRSPGGPPGPGRVCVCGDSKIVQILSAGSRAASVSACMGRYNYMA